MINGFFRPTSPNSRLLLRVVVLLLVALGTFLLAIQVSQGDRPIWSVEIADPDVGWNGGYLQSKALDLDQNGMPHIAYFDDTNDDLRYAYKDAGGWHILRLDQQSSVGRDASLSLGADGAPHIAYNTGSGTVKYAFRSASGWQYETADATRSAWGCCTSLALDQDGFPHISYMGPKPGTGSYQVRYAHRDAAGWYTETLYTDSGKPENTSLVLDADGYPRMSYVDNPILMYAERYAWGWRRTPLNESEAANLPSLALDSAGYPHIAYLSDNRYHRAYTYTLKYTFRDSAGWQTETIDSSRCDLPALVIDSNDIPHVVYESGDGKIKYASRSDNTWRIETVSNYAYYGDNFTSLALDSSGRPHIAYHDGQGIYYARKWTATFGAYVPLVANQPAPTPLPTNVVTLTATADATIFEGYPTTNFGKTSDMWVGYDDYLSPNGEIVRGLMKFDLSALPASTTISRATLRVYLIGSYDFPRTFDTIAAHQALDDWEETSVTSDNRPLCGRAYGEAEVGIWGYSSRWIDIDVTELIQEWVRGAPNYGIMLRGEEAFGSDSSWRAFSTREGVKAPELVVATTSSGVPEGHSAVSGGASESQRASLFDFFTPASASDGTGRVLGILGRP